MRRCMHVDSLDTNLILRFILGDDSAARERVREILDAPSTMHHVEDLAISEVVYVLEAVYEQTRKEIATELQMFLTRYSGCLVYNQRMFAMAIPFYEEHPKVSFNDCCLASYAELTGAEPLLTFDKKLAAQHPAAKAV